MTVLVISFVMSLVGVLLYLSIAPRLGLIDRPNDRSLHGRPTVVGAGLPVVLAILLGWMLAPGLPLGAPLILAALALGLAMVGLLDDRYRLPSTPRLVIYGVASLAFVVVETSFDLAAVTLAVLAMLWMVNLFNFMDGADGFAGLQALLVAVAMGLLSVFAGQQQLALLWCVMAAALLPFLGFNWPPARCFMGDAGSVPLGFLLGAGGLVGMARDPQLGVGWLILMMPFLLDATATLVIRLFQGHPPHEAHRDHSYQRLVRRLGSPLPLDLGLAVLHLAWLFPLAMTAMWQPLFTPILVIFSAIPSLLLLVYMRRPA